MVYPETFKGIAVTDYDDWNHPQLVEFTPRPFREYDVDIEIECCGICGSDIHAAQGNWGRPYKPLVVGHEIVGKVVRVGDQVRKGLKVGDRVGVGAQCDSDGKCVSCDLGYDSNCRNFIGTYLGTYKDCGVNTMGGNASHIRLNSKFAFKIPDGLASEYAAPLLCGGITGFSPLLQAGIGKGLKVGVSGIGGIGHMTILFAKALGAEVTAISRNDKKKGLAAELGADHYAATDDPDFEEKYANTLDFLVNTSSSFKGLLFDKTLDMLKPRGKMTYITVPEASENLELKPWALILKNLSVQGSAIGSVEEIEHMLEFAAKHDIKPWVETIDISEEALGKAWDRTNSGDVKFRFTMTGYDKFFKEK